MLSTCSCTPLLARPWLRTRSSARALPVLRLGSRAASAVWGRGFQRRIWPPNPAPAPLYPLSAFGIGRPAVSIKVISGAFTSSPSPAGGDGQRHQSGFPGWRCRRPDLACWFGRTPRFYHPAEYAPRPAPTGGHGKPRGLLPAWYQHSFHSPGDVSQASAFRLGFLRFGLSGLRLVRSHRRGCSGCQQIALHQLGFQGIPLVWLAHVHHERSGRMEGVHFTVQAFVAHTRLRLPGLAAAALAVWCFDLGGDLGVVIVSN